MKHETIARRMQQALSNADMTARELSVRSGVSEASISQYINGRNIPSNISAGRMAEILKCDPVWLMGYDVQVTKNAALTWEEAEIIVKYRELTPDQKLLVRKMLGVGTRADGTFEENIL